MSPIDNQRGVAASQSRSDEELGIIHRQNDVGRIIPAQIDPVFGLYLARGFGSGFSRAGIDVVPGEATAVYHQADSVSSAEEIAGGPEINADGIHAARFEK